MTIYYLYMFDEYLQERGDGMKLPAYIRKSIEGVSARDCEGYYDYRDYSDGYTDYADVFN